MRPRILTHRGLDPSQKNYFVESSREVFEDQLARGFGLEFDIRKTKDGGLAIIHDDSLRRISKGSDTRKIGEIPVDELLAMEFDGCHLTDLKTLLAAIRKRQTGDALSAIHLKHATQEPETLDLILEVLKDADPSRFIIFDVIPETAHYLLKRNPALALAPSVSHPYDIQRYGAATGNTLYPIEQIVPLRNIFSWVWLDEWDRSAMNGGTKSLYREETFDVLRRNGFSIAVISPELHASSPGLLGGEAHPDARDRSSLENAIKNILGLKPDIICTDYPDMVRGFRDGIFTPPQ
ncbi:MAG: glycerophosphodiester phosphodiesterase family protein [Candidatus Pacebacteria bacterium]|nr:glycerophosphodiester phosphodiesterase family protein [Candidatus Paceibacterota bacterium]